MPRSKKSPSSRRAQPHVPSGDSHVDAWSKLTWDDLDRNFDTRSVQRGRTYQRSGHVKDLVVSSDGRLLATVRGMEQYITSAQLDARKRSHGRIAGICTCPVHLQCKHAVAVIAEYLAQAADGKAPAAGADDDPRWAHLARSPAERYSDDIGDADHNFEEDDYDTESDEDAGDMRRAAGNSSTAGLRGASRNVAARTRALMSKAKTLRRTRADWDARIEVHLKQQSAAELVQCVVGLIQRYPELRDEFQERILLSEGDASRLIDAARQELRTVTAEIGWRNHWNNEGHTPDYSRVLHRLERLIEAGQADAVVKLGWELIERGMSQIEQSHDDGETGMALAKCLPVIFGAVAASSLPAADKILYAIDACEFDHWDYIRTSADTILDAPWKKSDWSAVADVLASRLNGESAEHEPPEVGADGAHDADRWSRDYRRDSLSNWLAHALRQARRDDVLRWYDAILGESKSKSAGTLRTIGRHSGSELSSRVAAAVTKSHPERALEIYRCQLESCLPQADSSASESAANCLRKMRPILRSLGRDAHWIELVQSIREKYRNRPRFMETLDHLEGRPIVASQKRQR
ncbi:MAG: hypothetical protein U0795_10890 [Pirellulales bacterium]